MFDVLQSTRVDSPLGLKAQCIFEIVISGCYFGVACFRELGGERDSATKLTPKERSQYTEKLTSQSTGAMQLFLKLTAMGSNPPCQICSQFNLAIVAFLVH